MMSDMLPSEILEGAVMNLDNIAKVYSPMRGNPFVALVREQILTVIEMLEAGDDD